MVTEEGASARVGSRFSDIRDVEQVRLHKGEVVEVLESPRPAGQAATAGSPSGRRPVVQNRSPIG